MLLMWLALAWGPFNPTNLELARPGRDLVEVTRLKVQRLNPEVPDARARAIARAVLLHSPWPNVALGIMMQESAFRDIHTYEMGPSGHMQLRDLGIAQVNIHTAAEAGCNIAKLIRHDLSEGIECQTVILERKRALCKKLGNEWWSCYHSTTPSLRRHYFKIVNRYIKRIKEASWQD